MRFPDSGRWDAAGGRSCVPHGARGVPGVPRGLCGSEGAAPSGEGEVLPPSNLRGTEAAPPPRAAGGSAGGSAPEEGGAAGTPGSGVSRGSGSGTESGGGTEHRGRAAGGLLGFPRYRSAAPGGGRDGRTDRQVRTDRRPDRQTGPGAALSTDCSRTVLSPLALPDPPKA